MVHSDDNNFAKVLEFTSMYKIKTVKINFIPFIPGRHLLASFCVYKWNTKMINLKV